jgi:hypothetical protein
LPGSLIVRFAVDGIAQASIPEPDAVLQDLLAETIRECAAWINPTQHAALDGREAALTLSSSQPG